MGDIFSFVNFVLSFVRLFFSLQVRLIQRSRHWSMIKRYHTNEYTPEKRCLYNKQKKEFRQQTSELTFLSYIFLSFTTFLSLSTIWVEAKFQQDTSLSVCFKNNNIINIIVIKTFCSVSSLIILFLPHFYSCYITYSSLLKGCCEEYISNAEMML